MVNNIIIEFRDDIKNLPCDQLHNLFYLAGWSDESITEEMMKNFNRPFINSTLVLSVWSNERLVGCIRVLSDKVIRSVIHDLVIDPEFWNHGIGKELVRRSIKYFQNTEWLIQTTKELENYYINLGFKKYPNVVLYSPSKWEK